MTAVVHPSSAHPAYFLLRGAWISQADVAAGYGCSQPSVSRYLLGQVRVPELFRHYVAGLLRRPVSECFLP